MRVIFEKRCDANKNIKSLLKQKLFDMENKNYRYTIS